MYVQSVSCHSALTVTYISTGHFTTAQDVLALLHSRSEDTTRYPVYKAKPLCDFVFTFRHFYCLYLKFCSIPWTNFMAKMKAQSSLPHKRSFNCILETLQATTYTELTMWLTEQQCRTVLHRHTVKQLSHKCIVEHGNLLTYLLGGHCPCAQCWVPCKYLVHHYTPSRRKN